MAGNATANFGPLISRTEANTAFRDALRLFVGRGRHYSVKELSIGTGITARMIESFMAPVEGGDFRKPDLEEVLSLAAFLGADFVNGWINLAEIGAFDLPEDIDPSPGAIAADCAADTAEIAGRAADGEFCPDDKRALRVVGARKMQRGSRLIAMAAAA